MGKQGSYPHCGIIAAVLFSVFPILPGACTDEGPAAGFAAAGSGTVLRASSGTMTGFRFEVFDESFRNWTSELGSMAVRSDGTENIFNPCDASRIYWPEGRVYSFFAVAADDSIPPDGACTFTRNGNDLYVRLSNPDHNLDFVAAKALGLEKTAGVPLEFSHAGARISQVSILPGAWLDWIRERELAEVADLEITSITVTDASEQTYLFSRGGTALFGTVLSDYRDYPAVDVGLPGGMRAGLRTGGVSAAAAYHTFPGTHVLAMSFHEVGYDGKPLLGEKTLYGEFSVMPGESVTLGIAPDPSGNILRINCSFVINEWEEGGEYNVTY